MRKILLCLILLSLWACTTQTQWETYRTSENSATSSPTESSETPTIAATHVVPTPTVELQEYYDSELNLYIKYPIGWAEKSHGVFVGDDGYLIIQKLEGYHSPHPDTVSVDFANTIYSKEKPFIGCAGWGVDGCIVLHNFNPEEREKQSIISVIPYKIKENYAEYFTIETTWKYHLQINESIRLGERLLSPSSTPSSTELHQEPQKIYQDGFVIQEFSYDASPEISMMIAREGQEINSGNNCGIENDNILNLNLIKLGGGSLQVNNALNEIIFEYAGYGYDDSPWSFCNWHDKWIIETNRILIINGKILNHELGYEEIFGWHILQGIPIYFVLQNGKYYISINEHLVDIPYDEIFHYGCCATYVFNPHTDGEKSWIQVKRNGVDYTVVISTK